MITQQIAILKALSYQKYHTTPLVFEAMRIYKIETGKGGACRDNRFRELRKKGFVDSESDLLSEELIWSITEKGREHLKKVSTK